MESNHKKKIFPYDSSDSHESDIALKVRLSWATGNPLIKDESDRS
jgi:hypothetical protein